MTLRLEEDVVTIAREGGRVVGTPGHACARHYLLDRIAQLKLQPYGKLGFHGKYQAAGMTGHNLFGVLPGRDRRLPPLLLGAHYDSVIASPCADDNAAAVAIALAVAERIPPRELQRDLLMALFDAEEPPWFLSEAMGSIRFYEEQMDMRGVHCAVVLDLVGHDIEVGALGFGAPSLDRLKGLVFMTGAESHPSLANVARAAPRIPSLPLVAALNHYVGDMSDHGIFRRNGVPYLFFSCGRWEHYHQPSDTPDRLNYEKMESIASLLTALVSELDDALLGPSKHRDPGLPDPHARVDTLELELETMRDGFGDALSLLAQLTGCGKLESRAEVDRLVAALLMRGL